MLFQLVCTDRRYARMNCFNIRETQGILKRKFFTDLVNSHSHKNLLENSMIGLRYKSNSDINLDLDITSFYNFGIHNNVTNNMVKYNNSNITTTGNKHGNISIYKNLDFLLMNPSVANINQFLYNILTDLYCLLSLVNANILFCLPSISSTINLIFFNFTFINYSHLITDTKNNISVKNNSLNYLPSFNENVINLDNKNQFMEITQNQRFTRFNNSQINYDYKTGHYLGN
jgi:hypothetical protein